MLRRLEYCQVKLTDWPRPKRLSWAIWAVTRKPSPEERPAPTWKVPVGRSFTESSMTTRSGALPGRVAISTVSKYPSASARDRERSIAEPL